MKNVRILKSIKYLCYTLIDFFYPPFCFDCGGKVHNRRFFCGLCTDLILQEEIPPVEIYENEPIDRIITGFSFDIELVRNVVHSLKYSAISGPACELLEQRLAQLNLEQYDSVVPVPLHWRRKFKRGYNQAKLLSEVVVKSGVAAELLQPVKRIRYTKTQTKRNRWERKKAMKEVFGLKRNYESSVGKKILLVDDVCTTGSTARSCAVLLKKDGAVQVDLLALGPA